MWLQARHCFTAHVDPPLPPQTFERVYRALCEVLSSAEPYKQPRLLVSVSPPPRQPGPKLRRGWATTHRYRNKKKESEKET